MRSLKNKGQFNRVYVRGQCMKPIDWGRSSDHTLEREKGALLPLRPQLHRSLGSKLRRCLLPISGMKAHTGFTWRRG